MGNNILVCKKCVMDSIANPDFKLDSEGVCNYCHQYHETEELRIIPDDQKEEKLKKLIDSIKKNGVGAKYDCIIGLSGGTDSTYVALKVKEFGLRPLAVHLDNGWNSELSVSNIKNILDKLGIDLYTYVIDWEEFKDIQFSFLKASVPDIEIPTDHAITALLYKTAIKFKVRHIISGYNFNDEGIWPESWAYGHLDWKYIKSIHRRYGSRKIKTFPHFSILELIYYVIARRIQTTALLNYMRFNKAEARQILKEKLGWRDYGGKHNESVYTKFVQEYLLPKKFNIDVRKAYLSAPLLRGNITRDYAVEELAKPIASEESLIEQKNYCLKKLKITESEFEQLMNLPLKTRFDYPSNIKLTRNLRLLLNKARHLGLANS